MEIIRLRLLHPAQDAGGNAKALKLSSQEIQVVSAHLRANVEEIVSLLGDDTTAIQAYVGECSVIEIDESDLVNHHSPYYTSSVTAANTRANTSITPHSLVPPSSAGSAGPAAGAGPGKAPKRPLKTVFFKRGEPANTAILILSGKVEILAGKEGFRLELGAWAVLGQEALTSGEDQYIPDFSMAMKSPKMRVVCLKRPSTANSRKKRSASFKMNSA
jgi:hypothetical protein